MHRNTLLKKMENYEAFEQEKEFKSRIISFVKKHKDCFERSLEIGHITASCWLLNNDHTKALLMHHTKLDMWVQPGGHCDGDSDVVAVALKEAREESGIQGIEPVSTDIFDIDIHLIPENSKEKAHYHYDIRFLLQVTSNEEIIQNKESKELRWISKNPTKLPTQEISVTRMFNKWIKR